MRHKNFIVVLTLFLTVLFSGVSQFTAVCQDVATVRAIQQFKKGNFEEVLPRFQSLLKKNPEDKLLHYYYGASRTETGHFSESDLAHLEKALEGNPPKKINFYLGIQHQAQNNWTKALKYYNQFQLKATAEERRQLETAEKIQQCFNEKNPYTLSEGEKMTEMTEMKEIEEPAVERRIQTNEISEIETVDDISLFERESFETTSSNVPIEFPVNSSITYYSTSNFKSEKALELFDETENLKNQLDFSLREMEELREEYRSSTDQSERQSIGAKILAFENEALELRNEISQLSAKINNLENNYWLNASRQEVEAFQAKSEQALTAREKKPKEMNQQAGSEITEVTIDPGLLLDDNERADFLEKEEKENELVYKIQIGAYSRGLPEYVKKLFNKLSFIRKIDNYTDEDGVVVYTTGNLQNMQDAIKMRDQVRQEGVKDAFVVPYFKGKRITLEEAKKLETGS